MYKIVEAGSWRGPGMDLPLQLIKISSRGLIGNDRHEFLEKRSAASIFAKKLASIKLGKGDIPIHTIAIGATEAFGPNRNGDGFKEATCREVHDTFVKHAKFYRNHKNKDPKISYGKVAASAYNEPMRRIELLIIGNGTKEAAERNGGLPMDKKSVDRLHDGDSIPVSMACRVAFDSCQNCFNKAANRSQYCTEDTCISPQGKRLFGCRDGLTKVSSDGRMQYVENPHASMFDISEVTRPADRIAYGGLADYLQKIASADGRVIGGAELAELWSYYGGELDTLSPTDRVFAKQAAIQFKLAQVLAFMEQELETGEQIKSAARAVAWTHTEEFPVELLGTPRTEKFAVALNALAQQRIMLPLGAFVQVMTGVSREKAASISASVARHLPGIFGRLTADPQFVQVLRSNGFTHSAQAAPLPIRSWAVKQAAVYSLDPEAIQERVWRSAIYQAPLPQRVDLSGAIKSAAADESSEKLARQYATYQLAFLTAMPHDADNFKEICKLAVTRNCLAV